MEITARSQNNGVEVKITVSRQKNKIEMKITARSQNNGVEVKLTGSRQK